MVVLRFWTPQGGQEARERLRTAAEAAGPVPRTATRPRSGGGRRRNDPHREQAAVAAPARLSGGRLFMAFLPYLLVIAVFSLAKLVAPLTKALAAPT